MSEIHSAIRELELGLAKVEGAVDDIGRVIEALVWLYRDQGWRDAPPWEMLQELVGRYGPGLGYCLECSATGVIGVPGPVQEQPCGACRGSGRSDTDAL